MTGVERVNLILRAVMETGVVLGFAYWGFHTGHRPATRIARGLGTPALGFGIWGAVDFRQFGRGAETLRLIEELVLSALAAAALYGAGQHRLGWALLALSVGYHALVYASGGRLLKIPPGR